MLIILMISLDYNSKPIFLWSNSDVIK